MYAARRHDGSSVALRPRAPAAAPEDAVRLPDDFYAVLARVEASVAARFAAQRREVGDVDGSGSKRHSPTKSRIDTAGRLGEHGANNWTGLGARSDSGHPSECESIGDEPGLFGERPGAAGPLKQTGELMQLDSQNALVNYSTSFDPDGKDAFQFGQSVLPAQAGVSGRISGSTPVGKRSHDSLDSFDKQPVSHFGQRNSLSTEKKDSHSGTAHRSRAMWVDTHAPRCFSDLVGVDEAGISVLRWASEWRTHVAGGGPRPGDGVVLLSGPPGAGKTSLVRAVARASGFLLVEVNASDDRAGASVVQTINAVLGSGAVRFGPAAGASDSALARDAPKMLLLDEIDGAAEASLVAHVVSVAATCARPVVCVCNDVYVPALRSLRRAVRTVRVSPPGAEDVARLLSSVWASEVPGKSAPERSALVRLAEGVRGDVRAALHALQFLAVRGRTDAASLAPSFRDASAGVLDTVRSVFVRRPRNSALQRESFGRAGLSPFGSCPSAQFVTPGGAPSDAFDVDAMLDDETLGHVLSGVLEAYPHARYYDAAGLVRTCAALDALSAAHARSGLSFAEGARVALRTAHASFASATPHPGLRFPQADAAAARQAAAHAAALEAYRAGLRRPLSLHTLCAERAPFVWRILGAHADPGRFRIANPALLRPEERARLSRCAAILSSEGLSIPPGEPFGLEPAIGWQPSLRAAPVDSSAAEENTGHAAAVRAMLSAEVARLASPGASLKHAPPGDSRSAALMAAYRGIASGAATCAAPAAPSAVRRDFFGRPIAAASAQSASAAAASPKVAHAAPWFRFNEGVSRAVRRDISVGALLASLAAASSPPV